MVHELSKRGFAHDVAKLCGQVASLSKITLANEGVARLVERPFSTAFMQKLVARPDVHDFRVRKKKEKNLVFCPPNCTQYN